MNIEKKKPYVICHLIASLDGRISGESFLLPETLRAMEDHWPIRSAYDCQAVLNGTVTAAEIYADGFLGEGELAPELGACGIAQAFPGLREDYIAPADLDRYVVCLDPEGTLRWKSSVVDRPVQPRSHVIQVVTKKVADEYLLYLREKGISYLFAGEDQVDIPLLMEKLVSHFPIRRVLVTGGGLTDWLMMEAGVVDEVSVILTPTISGDRQSATLFDRPEGREAKAFALDLIEARRLDHGGVLLRYKTRE